MARRAPMRIKIKHPGAFTRKAKAAHMSVSGYAAKVLRKKSRATTTTKRQANFARNAKKWKH